MATDEYTSQQSTVRGYPIMLGRHIVLKAVGQALREIVCSKLQGPGIHLNTNKGLLGSNLLRTGYYAQQKY